MLGPEYPGIARHKCTKCLFRLRILILLQQARAQVDAALDDASERGGVMMEAAQDAATTIEETLEDVITQRPLATVALALGVGFLIGVTWRR